MNSLIAKARYDFHANLFNTNTLTLDAKGVASNADSSSRASIAISKISPVSLVAIKSFLILQKPPEFADKY